MKSIATRYSATILFGVLIMMSLCIGVGFASGEGESYNASLQTVQTALRTDSPDASTVNVLVGAGTSVNSRAPQGSQRYIRTIYFIAASEMAAAGFPAGADINLIGFNYSIAQSITTTGSFLVYLENTTDAAFTKPSSLWTDLIAPMTLVDSNNVTIPAATGFFDIPFVGGSAFTYTGGGLYVAFEYQNASNPLSTANTALCNTAIASGLKNAFSTTVLPTSVGAFSAFRPYTRLGTSLDDFVRVPVIYSLGKIPVPIGNPDDIKVPVLNVSASPQTFDVTATVKKASDGTVRFTLTQSVVALAGGATQVVSFPGWSPTVIEDDSIVISTSAIAGETFTSNNRVAMLQSVNATVFTHAQGTTAAGGVGFTGATGDFVAKFTTNGATSVDQVQLNFNAGGQPYQIGIWDATGTAGAPGANIFTSTSLTSAVGVVVVPINPPVPVNGSFYIGVKQTGTVNVSFSYQGENPFRAATFYFTSPTGGTTWTDFSPNNQFRFMIEPRITVVPNSVDQTTQEVPGSFVLSQNYPNPFNPSSTIRYGLPNSATVRLVVYNQLGQEVVTLASGIQNAGTHEVRWDGRNSAGTQVGSGVYFYRLEAQSGDQKANFAGLKKMLFLK